MYDLIGDIHGQARELEALLDEIGYQWDGEKVIDRSKFVAVERLY